MKARCALLLLLAGLVASGCYTTRATIPGVLRNDIDKSALTDLGPLRVERTQWFVMGAGGASSDFLAREIEDQVAKVRGDGVRSLRYETEFSLLDVIVSRCTLGALVPRTFRVTGQIVRIRRDPASADTSSQATTTALDPRPPSEKREIGCCG